LPNGEDGLLNGEDDGSPDGGDDGPFEEREDDLLEEGEFRDKARSGVWSNCLV
jgi:hypothetical protein